MDNLQKPQTAEQKHFLEKECGLVPYQPYRAPNYCDPDQTSCMFTYLVFLLSNLDHVTSALIFGLSAAGRWYAPQLGVTRIPFTVSMLLVPVFYYLSINLKEKRFTYTSSERRSFE